MPQWLWITLAISIFVVLFIGYGTFFFLKHKEKKIIAKYKQEHELLKQELKDDEKIDEKLKDSIETRSWLAEDFEFILNTIKKNNYQDNLFIEKKGLAFSVIQYQMKDLNNKIYSKYLKKNYLLESFKKVEAMWNDEWIISEAEDKKYDFVFIEDNDYEINDLFDWAFKKLKDKGMIVIKDIQNRKEEKRLISFLKLTKLKFEYTVSKNSFLIIVK